VIITRASLLFFDPRRPINLIHVFDAPGG